MSIAHEIKHKQKDVYKELQEKYLVKKKRRKRKRRKREEGKEVNKLKNITTRDIEQLMRSSSYRRGKGGAIKQIR